MKSQLKKEFRFLTLVSLILGVVAFSTCTIQRNMSDSSQDSATQTKASAETCDQYGTILINGGQYIVQNNVWGATTRQCVSVPDTSQPSFTVSVSEHNQGSVAAYPSIYLGDHWGTKTTGWTSVQVSRLSTATYSWSVTATASGTYNVAAEAWLSPNTTGSGGYSGGAELMIWLDAKGMQPAGSQIGTYGSFQVWYANIGWNYICYYQTGKSSGSFNLKDFINDAMSRGYIQSSWYLHDIEAGFEIMSGGQGLKVNSFSATITGGGTTSSVSSRASSASSVSSRASSVSSRASSVSSVSSRASSAASVPSGSYTEISIPFTKDGAGEFYWKTKGFSTTPNDYSHYVNSWNLDILEINGTSYVNKWVPTFQIPAASDGYWYIHYKGSYSYSHMEIK